MFDFKPIGYRVLVEMTGERKLPFAIKLPNNAEIDGIEKWVVRAKGDDMILAMGERVPIYQVEEGDEIVFDHRRSVEPMPPMMCGGRRFALVDVEAIVCVVKGEAEPVKPTPKLFIPDKQLAA